MKPPLPFVQPSLDETAMAEEALRRIREFNVRDINEILAIEEQAFPKTAYSRETILQYAAGFPGHFVVIEVATGVAGYIIFDTTGHVHSTAVKRGYRRKGFGRMLFLHALKRTKKRLWLEVRSKNNGAIGFYESLGMETVGRIAGYYGSDDAVIMALGQKE
jgi:ribosomal protein S18 acetylase RimI-like enzyme